MNLFIVTGNIAKMYQNSPENVKLVIADQYKDRTEFISVMLFGERAAWATKWIQVGDHVLAQGSIGSYDSGSGSRKMSLVAHKICFEGYPSPRRRSEKAQTFTPAIDQSQNTTWAKPVAMPDDLTIDEMIGG